MFISTTPQALIDTILASCDEEEYGRIDSAQLCTWINNELTTAWQWIRRCNRDALTKVSAQIAMPSTGNVSMTAASPGLAISDWGQPRAVDAMIGTNVWKKLRAWNFLSRDRIGFLSYRFLGETLYIQPIEQAQTYPLRVWYTYKAPSVSVAALSTPLSIVDGLDAYIEQGVSAKVRIKLDDDPSIHLGLQAQAMKGVKAMLATAKGDQSIIADVSGEYGPEIW